MNDAAILQAASGGNGRLDRIDRHLFKGVLQGLKQGSNSVAVVAVEPTGTRSVKRIAVSVP